MHPPGFALTCPRIQLRIVPSNQNYALFSAGESLPTNSREAHAPERRKDFYRVIVTCLTASPDTVWRVLKLEVLSRAEAEEVVKRVYGKHYRSGAP